MMPPVGAMPTVTGTYKEVDARPPAAIVAGTVATTVAPAAMAMAISTPMHFLGRGTRRGRRLEHVQASGRRVGGTCQQSGKAHHHCGAGDRYSSHAVRSIVLRFAGGIQIGNGRRPANPSRYCAGRCGWRRGSRLPTPDLVVNSVPTKKVPLVATAK
jgi:hypothetical protein